MKAGGGLPLVYMHTQISTGSSICNVSGVPARGGVGCKPLNDAKTYADSRVLDSHLQQVHYSTCAAGADLPLFVPTASNTYGNVMREYVEKAFSLGAAGVFHVRATASYFVQAPAPVALSTSHVAGVLTGRIWAFLGFVLVRAV